jgi:hypothetical protein
MIKQTLLKILHFCFSKENKHNYNISHIYIFNTWFIQPISSKNILHVHYKYRNSDFPHNYRRSMRKSFEKQKIKLIWHCGVDNQAQIALWNMEESHIEPSWHIRSTLAVNYLQKIDILQRCVLTLLILKLLKWIDRCQNGNNAVIFFTKSCLYLNAHSF